MPPVEFHAHFGEDMLLGGGVFDGIGVFFIILKSKKVQLRNMQLCKGCPFVRYVGKPVFSGWDKFGTMISKFKDKWWDI